MNEPSVGAARDGVRHLYVHLPFCAHRCGYCDFVTLVGRRGQHALYVDALLAELELERQLLAPQLETVYLGGGTPTFTEPVALARLLAVLPRAAELTVEANPETVTSELALLLHGLGVTRVSLGVQSFQPHLLEVLERRAGPDVVRTAFYHLRDVGFDNISLDLVYGVPGQSPSDLERDLAEATGLGPEHLSCYELEAKPGTRFAHVHGEEFTRQAEAMEGYFELVVETLVGVGYRWYETANFCREGRQARHNLAYWLGRDYLGLGIGAVSTVGGMRWRNVPSLPRYLGALRRADEAAKAAAERADLPSGRGFSGADEPALLRQVAPPRPSEWTGRAPQRPPREFEPLGEEVRRREQLILGLRLDEPIPLAETAGALDEGALVRLERLGLVERRGGGLALSERGRFVGGAVTAELLA